MRDPADADRIGELARELGRVVPPGTRMYLTGGATAVLEGWRQSTADVDVRFEPDSDVALRHIGELKERLSVNVEPELYRFPAVDPGSLRAAVESLVSGNP